MHCVIHPDNPAVGACVSCGHMVCAECKVEVDDRIYCKTCIVSRMTQRKSVRRLFRSQSDKKLAGVCGGLGSYFDIDSNIIRVVFVILCIPPATLVGVIGYAILAILLPMEDEL